MSTSAAATSTATATPKAAEPKSETMCVLESSDGRKIEVKKSICLNQSEFLKVLVSDGEDNGSNKIEVPPLSKVNFTTLEKIVEFMNHYDSDAMKEIPKPLKSVNLQETVGTWYNNYVEISLDAIVEIMLAANYLNIVPLVNLCAAKIASLIQSRPIAEVKKTFNVVGDFTKEEFEEVEKTYPFLKDA